MDSVCEARLSAARLHDEAEVLGEEKTGTGPLIRRISLGTHNKLTVK